MAQLELLRHSTAPEIDMDRTKPLLEQKKNSVRVTAGAVSGNYAVGINLVKSR